MKDCKTTKREAIEWINIRWHDEAETARLPRVLLIGDSIVAGHATLLRDKLKGRFGIDYFATSKIVSDHEFMPDLLFMLGRYKYDMIIFNNGLHGSAIDDGAYGKALFATLSVLKQYAPQLVWRNSTPCYPSSDKKTNPWITRVQKRNRIASKEVAKLDILTIDCYKVLAGKPELSSDGAHLRRKAIVSWLIRKPISLRNILPKPA